jgi:hypothetical protein
MSSELAALRAARFAYPLGLLLLVAPFLELAGRIWPLQWYLVQWRFQSELALVNAAPAILIGATIVAAIAWLNEDIGILKLGGLLLVTFGVVLVPVVVMLGLDAMQLRQMARAELRGSIRNNAIVAVMRGGLGALAAIGMGIGVMKLASALNAPAAPARRPAAASTTKERKRDDDSDGLLVVGSAGE